MMHRFLKNFICLLNLFSVFVLGVLFQMCVKEDVKSLMGLMMMTVWPSGVILGHWTRDSDAKFHTAFM